MHERCPTCEEPLEADGFCRTCALDDDNRRRDYAVWRTYVESYKERMGAIVEAAQRVCDRDELELLGADLLEWPEERTASFFGVTVDEVRVRRDAIHAKVRAAIDPQKMAEITRRRRA